MRSDSRSGDLEQMDADRPVPCPLGRVCWLIRARRSGRVAATSARLRRLGLLAVGCVVTVGVIASALGHVLVHTAAILHGGELPPVIRTMTIARQEAVPGDAAWLPPHPPQADTGALLYRRS